MSSPQPLLGEEERQSPRALVEHALRLIGRIHRAGPEAAAAAEAELQQWRQASPVNANAVATAQRVWDATSADALRDRLPLPPTAKQQRSTRRRIVGMLGVAGFVAAAGAGGRWYWLRPVYEIALRTGRAQTLAHALPEGGALDLAANTALQVIHHRDRRTVQLAGGEARFDVKPEERRPFNVETKWGRVRALGTVFTVSVRDGHMRVAVAQGRVGVWPAGSPGGETDAGEASAVILQAGQAIESDTQGMGERTSIDVDEVADWKRGWLVFRNTRLPEAVARWNDYLGQPLSLADDTRLRALRVTGSYPLRNPQAFLDSLPSMLPVRIGRTADGAVEISARR